MSGHASGKFPVSPCIGVCDTEGGEYCVGCKRSMREIASWGQMSSDEKWALLRELETRELPPRNA